MPTAKNGCESGNEVKAFNEGCQARIDGVPMWRNPHDKLSLATWWERGWQDAHKNWASWVKGRWFPRLLPHAEDCGREHVIPEPVGGTKDEEAG
jgi:hypothetical protein